METFNYSKALDLLKTGEKVSSTRWGTEGKVYVQKAIAEKVSSTRWGTEGKVYVQKAIAGEDVIALLLKDTVRNKTVVFTPSVENQLEDEWYLVDSNI